MSNNNNKGLLPPILNSALNTYSGASQIVNAENTQRKQDLALQQIANEEAKLAENRSILNNIRGINNQNSTSRNNSSTRNIRNIPNNTRQQIAPKNSVSSSVNSQPRPNTNNRQRPAPVNTMYSGASVNSRNSNKSSTSSKRQLDKQQVMVDEVPMDNSVGGLENMELSPKQLNALVDVIMSSDMGRIEKKQLLKVILNAIKSINTQDDQDLNLLKDKYNAAAMMPIMQQMLGGVPPPQQMQVPGYGGLSMMPYTNPMYGGNMYPPMMYPQQQQQMPNMQVDMLGNKINMLQMEMADLTRHLKDYTRRYMDVMREDDMQRIKTYIEELNNVKETVNEAKSVAEMMTPAEEEEEEPKPGLIEGAKNSIKNGLSAITSTVNSIGSTIGITGSSNNNSKPKSANNTPAQNETKPVNTPAQNETKPPANNNTSNKPVPQAAQEDMGDNMVDLDAYNSTSEAAKPEQVSTSASQNNDIESAIDELNEASNINTDLPVKPAANNTKPGNQAGKNNRIPRQPQPQPIVKNTANALSKIEKPQQPARLDQTGGAVDKTFLKTFKKLSIPAKIKHLRKLSKKRS